MRDVLLRTVGDLTVAESNCPRGARVAVVTYNNEVTTEIRFADSRKKAVLLDRIRNLQVALTSKQQRLETAMAFVARNTFKRVRSGFLMRRVAVFFSNKPTRATPQLREAVLKLWDAGITPLFLTSQEDRQLAGALQVCARGPGAAPASPPGSGEVLGLVRTAHGVSETHGARRPWRSQCDWEVPPGVSGTASGSGPRSKVPRPGLEEGLPGGTGGLLPPGEVPRHLRLGVPSVHPCPHLSSAGLAPRVSLGHRQALPCYWPERLSLLHSIDQ